MVCGGKDFDTENVNGQNCAKTKRVYGRKKTLFFVILCQNLLLMKKAVLKICEEKVTHPKRQGLKGERWKLVSSYESFLIKKNSRNAPLRSPPPSTPYF